MAKKISIFACLCLCIAMVAFGVYAATTTTFSITSKVSFSPTDAGVQVLGYITGYSDESTNVNQSYYAANYSTLGTPIASDVGNYTTLGSADTLNAWTLGDLMLDAGNSGVTAPASIKIYIQVSIFTERATSLTLTKSDTNLSSNNLTCTGVYYTESNDNSNVVNGGGGFYKLDSTPAWSVSNTPNLEPSGTHATNNLTFGSLISFDAASARSTTMFIITIAPNNFDAGSDLASQAFSITLSIT